MDTSLKRGKDESFEDYQTRRRMIKLMEKHRKRGNMLFSGGTAVNHAKMDWEKFKRIKALEVKAASKMPKLKPLVSIIKEIIRK